MDGGWGGDLPAVFGHEVAGVVTDIGPGVLSANVQMGDRVLVSLLRSCGHCERCEAGVPAQCVAVFPIDSVPRLSDGKGRPVRAGLNVGGFAESVVVDASQVVKIPVDVADEAACLISCGVMTGFGAAINTAGGAGGRFGRGVRLRGCRAQLRSGRGARGRLPAGRDRRERGKAGAGKGIWRDGHDQRHGRGRHANRACTHRRTWIRHRNDGRRQRARHRTGAAAAGARRCARGGGNASGRRAGRPSTRPSWPTVVSACWAARWVGPGCESTCPGCFASIAADASSSTSSSPHAGRCAPSTSRSSFHGAPEACATSSSSPASPNIPRSPSQRLRIGHRPRHLMEVVHRAAPARGRPTARGRGRASGPLPRRRRRDAASRRRERIAQKRRQRRVDRRRRLRERHVPQARQNHQARPGDERGHVPRHGRRVAGVVFTGHDEGRA